MLYIKIVMAAFVGISLFSSVVRVLACPVALPELNVHIKGTVLKLEVAVTSEARKCGLSRRGTLLADRGMLFVAPAPKYLDFWMPNTPLPLSIAFVDKAGRIISIQSMKPMQEKEHYRSPKQVCCAIEVNQGWFARHQVKVGDSLEMRMPSRR